MSFSDGMQEERKKKAGLGERLKRRYGAQPITGGRERVTMEGQRRVTVYGCRRIVVYSPLEIRLMLAKEELSIIGEALYCSSFSAGTVTVEGKIGGVLYRPYRQRLFCEGKCEA